MAMTARDVMEPSVLTVAPEASLAEVQRLFVEEGIGGAPVVDERGRVVGVITGRDVLRAIDEERDTAISDTHYFRQDLEFSGPEGMSDGEDFQDRLGELTAGGAMTPSLLAVAPDASVQEVAREIRRHRVHRILVIDDEELVGIISTFDLVALLEKPSG